MGLSEVNTAVNQMDQVTQQNAAMVEQATAAAAGLSSEARELGRLVAAFRTGEGAPIATMRPAAAPSSRPAVPPVRAAQARALAFATARAEDDWAEF